MPRLNWWGRVAFCGALAAAGAGAAFWEVTMSREFWSDLAMSDVGKEGLAASAVALSVFAGLFSFASGIARAIGRNVIGWIVAGIALVFTLYNVSSVCGFQLKERVGNVMLAEAKAKQASDDARERREDARQTRDKRIEWLQATFAAARKAEDKERLLIELAKAQQAELPSATANVPVVLPDVQASVFAGVIGTVDAESVRWMQVRMIGSMALLLGLGTMIAFWLAGLLWPMSTLDVIEPRLTITVTDPEPPAEEDLIDGEPASADTIPFPVPHRVSGERRTTPRPVTNEDDFRRVIAFFDEAGVGADMSVTASAGDVHQWFCQWDAALGREGMSMTRFGRIAAQVVPTLRFHDGRTMQYRGVTQPAFALSKAA